VEKWPSPGGAEAYSAGLYAELFSAEDAEDAEKSEFSTSHEEFAQLLLLILIRGMRRFKFCVFCVLSGKITVSTDVFLNLFLHEVLKAW